jgi:hypothetical protein
MQALLPFFEWCDSTLIGRTIRDSRFLFPIIESVHLLALTVLLGAVIVINLRLLGAGLRRQSSSLVARSLDPLMRWGFLVMVITGVLLFCSEALKCYESPPFRLKMLALLAAAVFHWTVVRPRIDSSIEPSSLSRIVIALVSTVLWFGVAVAGRAIGFY